jgi:LmbE family N-acetylglucosaminyl deacetylase
MAYDGIAFCFGKTDQWFTNITVTDGAGSPRSGIYADYPDERMCEIRRLEQRKAALIGGYSAQIQLDYPTSAVKDRAAGRVTQDLLLILAAARPEIVYLHNPADKHETHVAVFLRSLQALRALPDEAKPTRVYGCEVWRGLDWLPDTRKKALSAGDRPNLASALIAVFDSQIGGGKRYDLAIAGRRLANATFLEAYGVDQADAVTYAMDLTPLVNDPSLSVVEFVGALVDELRREIEKTIRRFS